MKLFWKNILIFSLLFVIFFVNAFHEKYPDEFDSIVGGKYIAEGKLPYRDWFQHHQPGAYVMAAGILPFSGQSFVRFRVGWEIVLCSFLIFTYFLLRSRLPKRDLSFYLTLLFVIGISATYFWGNMLLADTLSGYLLLPAFALIILKAYHDDPFTRNDLMIAGIFIFFSWFTSMTYTFVVGTVSLYALYLFVVSEKRASIKRIAVGISYLSIPYCIFGVYLWLTGSIKAYYWANIIYNTNYYIYNYPHEAGSMINPIRYAAVIADTFINNYLPALWGVTGFPVSNPVQVTLALSSASLLIILLLRKK